MGPYDEFMEMLRPYRQVQPGELIHVGCSNGPKPWSKLCGDEERTALACMQVSDATCETCLDIFNEGIVEELGLGK